MHSIRQGIKIYFIIVILFAIFFSGCNVLTSPDEPENRGEKTAKQYYEIGLRHEKRGDYSEALKYYQTAYRWDSKLPDIIPAIARIKQKIQAGSNYPSRPKTDKKGDIIFNPTPPFKSKPYITHTVKSGETFSNIAMEYYGSYKIQVYYEPAHQLLKLATILSRINDIKPENLKIGNVIKIPFLELSNGSLIKPDPQLADSNYDVLLKHGGSKNVVVVDIDAALDETRSSKIKPSCQWIRNVAMKYYREKKLIDAKAWFRKAYQCDPDCKDCKIYISKLTQGSPVIIKNSCRYMHNVAQKNYREEKYQEAKEWFLKALNCDPDCTNCQEYITKSENRLYRENLYNRGLIAYNNQDYDQAHQIFKQIVTFSPHYRDSHQKFKEIEEIVQDAQKSTSKGQDKDNFKVEELKESPYAKAVEYAAAKQWTKAREEYTELLNKGLDDKHINQQIQLIDEEIEKENIRAHKESLYSKAEKLHSAGNLQDSLDAFLEIEQFDPEYRDIHQKIQLLQEKIKENYILEEKRQNEQAEQIYAKAETYLANQEWKKAIEEYKHVKEIIPNFKNVNEQIEHAEKMIETQKQDNFKREKYRLAELHIKNKKWAEAIDALDQIYSIDKNYKDIRQKKLEAYYQKGILHYQEGRVNQKQEMLEKALNDFEIVWKIQPNYKKVTDYYNRTKALLKALQKLQNR